MKKKISILAVSIVIATASQAQLIKNIESAITGNSSSSNNGTGLSNSDIIAGLKEALNTGVNNSTGLASKVDGYLKNPDIFIVFPPEAQKIKTELINLGFKNKVDQFETSINRAAEEAAKSAAPVFLGAVKNMTLNDGLSILQGGDTAATHYLRQSTTATLTTKYTPIVKTALSKVNATAYWTEIVTIYNKIPFVKKENPNLTSYVTGKALNGLFHLVGKEEAKIRKDPAAQVTDLLKKVFGKK